LGVALEEHTINQSRNNHKDNAELLDISGKNIAIEGEL